MAGLAGKAVRVRYENGKFLKCQLDVTLSTSNTYEEVEPCKPGETDEETDLYIQRELQSQDTNVTVNQRAFVEANEAEMSPVDLLELQIAGTVNAVIDVVTTPGKHDQPNDMVIEIPVVIGDQTWAFPNQGRSTNDITFLGNGKPVVTLIPVGS